MSPFVSKLLALALLAAVVGAGYVLVVRPVNERFRTYEENRIRSGELLQRYRRIGATRKQLEAQVAELRRRRATSGGYIKGSSDTISAAELQNRVSRIVRSNGGTIKSAQILPAKEENDLKRIGLRVRLTADIASLQKILYSLEAGKTYLFLSNMDIRGARRIRRRNADSDTDQSLQVRFDLHGYTRPQES